MAICCPWRFLGWSHLSYCSLLLVCCPVGQAFLLLHSVYGFCCPGAPGASSNVWGKQCSSILFLLFHWSWMTSHIVKLVLLWDWFFSPCIVAGLHDGSLYPNGTLVDWSLFSLCVTCVCVCVCVCVHCFYRPSITLRYMCAIVATVLFFSVALQDIWNVSLRRICSE